MCSLLIVHLNDVLHSMDEIRLNDLLNVERRHDHRMVREEVRLQMRRKWQWTEMRYGLGREWLVRRVKRGWAVIDLFW